MTDAQHASADSSRHNADLATQYFGDSWVKDTEIDFLKAALASQAAALKEARAVMIFALDALESDADLDQRREAFALIQDQFDGVSHEDHDAAESLISIIRARPAPDATKD
jgi:hypothetical protein